MKFKSILLAGGALFALASGAQAADLPTRKAAPVPEKPNCYATFWTWLDSSAADCPLSYWGITFYGQVDVGAGYETNRTKFDKYSPSGVNELVNNRSHGAGFQWVPNGLSQSNVGIKWKEQIVPDWYFIGDVNAGFDPYSLRFANGPRSLLDNNGLPAINQSSNADSSRAYGPINTRAYAGLQNKTFGTLTYGRQYSFANDISNSLYDPFGGAYAFSVIGNSSTLGGGLGNTELARFTNSVKYLYSDHSIRAGGQIGVGGYSAGNNAQFTYEITGGFDWQGFSIDAVYKYGKDAVNLSSRTSLAPPGPNVLNATLSNENSVEVGAKYKWDRITFYSGYAYERLSRPSDLPVGAPIRRFNDGAFAQYGTAVQDVIVAGVDYTAFPKPKVTQVLWTGAKFAALPNVDLIFGYYHVWQNNYLGAAEGTTAGNSCIANTGANPLGGTLKGTNSNRCAGHLDAISGVVDWRPFKRVDVYAGAMYSKATGGIASGYFANDNLAATGGVRLSF